MTKASPSRVNRKKARANVASTALQVAAHGRIITVDIDGKPVTMWAMPASAHQVVMAALQTLSRA